MGIFLVVTRNFLVRTRKFLLFLVRTSNFRVGTRNFSTGGGGGGGHPNEPTQPKKGWSWDQIWSNHINNIIPLITLPIVVP